jgi:hypothetical protein
MPDDTNTTPAKGPAPGRKKTPGQSVAASRLVRKAKRRGYGKDAGDGVVFFAGADRRVTKGGRNKLTCSFVAQAFTINVSADVIVDVASHALLVYWRNTILEGWKPDGSGPQVSLSQATIAQVGAGGRLTPYRGAASGSLADNLRRSAITGTTTRAKCTIQPPTNRNAFTAQQAAKGIRFIKLGGEADEVIRLAVQRWLSAAIEDQAREADKTELTAKKADR